MKRVAMLMIGAIAGFAGIASGDDSAGRVTFTKDILPILQQNCQTCHRDRKSVV